MSAQGGVDERMINVHIIIINLRPNRLTSGAGHIWGFLTKFISATNYPSLSLCMSLSLSLPPPSLLLLLLLLLFLPLSPHPIFNPSPPTPTPPPPLLRVTGYKSMPKYLFTYNSG